MACAGLPPALALEGFGRPLREGGRAAGRPARMANEALFDYLIARAA